MPSYRRLAVVVALALFGVAGCASTASGPAAPGPSVGQRLDAPLPSAVRDSVLVASTGRRLTLRSLTGKVLVISDMMTLCQETCPLDTANLVAASRAVEQAGLGGQVEFLSITIDPVRDTPMRLAAYRRLYAPAPANWLVLTAGKRDLAAMWHSLGVYIQKVPDTGSAPKDWLTHKPLTYDLTHSDELFFVDAHGRERFLLEGAPHVAPGAPVPARIKAFMDAQGRQNITHPDPLAWTLPQALQAISWLTGRTIPDSAR